MVAKVSSLKDFQCPLSNVHAKSRQFCKLIHAWLLCRSQEQDGRFETSVDFLGQAQEDDSSANSR